MKITYALFAALMLTCSIACSDDDNAEPTAQMSDFEGSWIATSMIITRNANPDETMDIVANGGEIRFTVLSDGRTRTWVEFGALSDEWDAQGVINGNKITMTPAEQIRPVKTFSYRFEGDALVLTNTDDIFDFTLTGTSPEPATSVGTFVRH